MHPVTPSPSSPRPGATAHLSVSHQQRHDRYTAALALLGSPEAIIRLGGALALVELADDWLTDETDPQEHGRRKAQTIITTLCAYICSPFQLAHDYERLMGDQPQGLTPQQARRFRAEKTELAAEAQVRGRILTEIHDRVRWEPSDGGQPATSTAPDPDKVTAGLWSHLRFDFSGAVFFYPVDFTQSYWGAGANFRGCTYRDQARFTRSIYGADALFDRSVYHGEAFLSDSVYRAGAGLSECVWGADARLVGCVYEGNVNLSACTWEGAAYLSDCTYYGYTYLADSVYRGDADFWQSTFYGTANLEHCTYSRGARFEDSIYHSAAYLGDSVFRRTANLAFTVYWGAAHFGGCVFAGQAWLDNCVWFGGADFSGVKFKKKTDFEEAHLLGAADFSGASFARVPAFTDGVFNAAAENLFEVSTKSKQPLPLADGLPQGARALTATERQVLAERLQAAGAGRETNAREFEQPRSELIRWVRYEIASAPDEAEADSAGVFTEAA